MKCGKTWVVNRGSITSLGPHFSDASYSGELTPGGLSAAMSGCYGTMRTMTARPAIFMPLPSGLPVQARSVKVHHPSAESKDES